MQAQFVVATRETEANFYTRTATGKSLALYRSPYVDVRLYPENKEGLPTIYNRAMKEFGDGLSLFIFAHDDLLILDFCWLNTILNGSSHFGIVGVAGNKRRVPYQILCPYSM